MLKSKSARLCLEDGTQFEGYSFGAERCALGEVVFNTAMTGYPESLTDPSYAGQILVLTFPLVGNYGVPDESSIDEFGLSSFFESDKIHIRALVVSDYSFKHSHFRAVQSLGDWLKKHDIPGIFGVDTRAITKIIREHGVMLGRVEVGDAGACVGSGQKFEDPNANNLVAEVSCKDIMVYGEGGEHRVVLVDCGCKNNIIRCLVRRGATVVRVPWDYDFTQLEYDGVMLSNGPGDPKMCGATVENIRKAFEVGKPIFGICMGNQLTSIAAGATTYKMKYGHRSHNQPALMCGTNRAVITSQNHGFAVDPAGLSAEWEPYFVNLNDGTLEGIKHVSKPFFTVQFHPEATSGPVDTEFLFDQFIDAIKTWKTK